MNGMPSNYPCIRSLPHQHPLNLPQFRVTPSPSIPSNSLSTNLFHHLLRQKGELLNQDFYIQQQPSSSLDESTRYTPSSSSHFVHSSSK